MPIPNIFLIDKYLSNYLFMYSFDFLNIWCDIDIILPTEENLELYSDFHFSYIDRFYARTLFILV